MAKKKNKSNFDLIYKIFALVLALAIVLYLYSITIGKVNVQKDQPVASKTDLKTVTSFVNKAALLIEQQGDKAYPLFREKNTEWWTEDQYIFVYDQDGNTLVLPPQQELEGTNRYWTKDANGIYFVKEMVDSVKDSGWVKYDYPKPEAKETSSKVSYFKKVKSGDKTVIVGSGMYLN